MNPLTKIMDLALGRVREAMEPAPMGKTPEHTPAQLCNLCRQQLERSVQLGLAWACRHQAIHEALGHSARLSREIATASPEAAHYWTILDGCIRKAHAAQIEPDYKCTVAGGHIDMALDKLDELQEALR